MRTIYTRKNVDVKVLNVILNISFVIGFFPPVPDTVKITGQISTGDGLARDAAPSCHHSFHPVNIYTPDECCFNVSFCCNGRIITQHLL